MEDVIDHADIESCKKMTWLKVKVDDLKPFLSKSYIIIVKCPLFVHGWRDNGFTKDTLNTLKVKFKYQKKMAENVPLTASSLMKCQYIKMKNGRNDRFYMNIDTETYDDSLQNSKLQNAVTLA